MPDKQHGIIDAFALSRGNARTLTFEDLKSWRPDEADSWLWVNLDASVSESSRWFREESGIDPIVAEALLDEDARPRSFAAGNGLAVILRGVNTNPGADPNDLISIGAWIAPGRVITLQRSAVVATQVLREEIMAGRPPSGPGDFLVQLASRLVERMDPVLEALNDEADDLEDRLVDEINNELRGRLGELRRTAIRLRRHLMPQRDAVSHLQNEPTQLLTPLHRAHLREVADDLTRYLEDLDAIRERAAVTQEELSNRISEQINRTMYILSLVASVFLPLGLITGLLGVNVGGIPGSGNPWAFDILCVVLLAVAGLSLWLFHRMRFF